MARIQWTYKDYRTKGSVVNDVESWKVGDLIDVNRGTYRDTWAIMPVKLGKPLIGNTVGVSGGIVPDDGTSVPAVHDELHVDYPTEEGVSPGGVWTGAAAGKVRVPDEIMHVPPRTRFEEVAYMLFYNGPFTNVLAEQNLLSGVTAVAATEIFTLNAHGLVTGDIVRYATGTGFAGLVSGDYYFVAKLSANTFYLCSTLANAYTLTPVNITTDGSAGVLIKTRSTQEPTGEVVGFVELAEIVCWNYVND